jgi:hypothetical protein
MADGKQQDIQEASSTWSKRGSAQCTIIYANWLHGPGIGTDLQLD